jgi:hypothetical protein
MGSGRDDTIQVTASLHGGVVRDPRYVTYSEGNETSRISRGKGRIRVTSNSAPTTASRNGMMASRPGFGHSLSCNKKSRAAAWIIDKWWKLARHLPGKLEEMTVKPSRTLCTCRYLNPVSSEHGAILRVGTGLGSK